MLSVNPQGIIKLCRTPLEEDQQNQLNFASAEAQLSYFNGTVQKTLENYTYVREDSVICAEVPYDEAINYNYLFYRNVGFTNKYWFCFITKVEYVNENTSNIYIKTDVWQTFHLSLNYTQCFVEREHVANDTRGLHTVPEGLETGDPVVNGDVTDFTTFANNMNDYVYVMAVTELPKNCTVSPNMSAQSYFNGIEGGLYLVGCEGGSATHISSMMWLYDLAGNASAVQSVFIAPKMIFGRGIKDGSNPDDGFKWERVSWSVTNNGETRSIQNVLHFRTYSSGGTPHEAFATLMAQKTFTSVGNLRGYVPKNNKMYCYPFNYLNVTNNAGSVVTYRWEDFTNNTASFDELGVVTPGCSIRLEPRNYKGIVNASETALDYGLSANKYPICSFQSDVYTNWLTQNSLNLQWVGEQVGLDLPNISLGKTDMSIASALQAGAVGLMQGYTAPTQLFDTGMEIFGALQQKYKMSLTPPQAKGNNNVSDVTFSAHRADFTAVPMSIKAEYAKMCDDYMSMYGYLVNSLKVPEITSRPNWNYVRTIGCNFTGNTIPQEALAEIRGLFDRGITIWHNPSTFGDYSQNNYASTR